MNSDGSQINGNRIGFWTGTNGDPLERMSITASGNIGIGTTSPQALLNAYGGAMTDTQVSIGSTSTDGAVLQNTTAATSSVQQFSPRLHFTGQGWKTNATAASQSVDFIEELQPQSGAANPSGNLVWSNAINGGSYSSLMTLTSAGNLGIGTATPGALFTVGNNAFEINSSGTVLAGTWNGGTVGVGYGGTGLTSGTSGGVPYFNASNTMASSGALTANLPVIGGGAGAAPGVGTVTGNTTKFATSTGTLTSGNCAKWDASGNIIDAGTTCGGGSLTWPLAGSADSNSAPDYSWSGHTNTGLYYDSGIGFTVAGSSIGSMTSTGLNGMAIGVSTASTGAFTIGAFSGTITDTQSIGTSSTDGVVLTNTTAATSTVQQFSPRLHFTGQGWKTNATAASQSVDFIVENQPQSGAANPSGKLVWSNAVNGGSYNTLMTLTSGGNVGIGSTSPVNALDLGLAQGIHIAAGTPSSTGAALYNVGGTLTWGGSSVVTGNVVTSFSAGTTGLTPNSATTGAVTLAGTLGVANGGTGATTFTSNGILYGNTTSAVQATAQGGANTVLTANAGAPSFSASPTIGGALTTTQAINATSTDGLVLTDPTAATSGNQKWSPRIHFTGHGWKTNATAASQAVDFIQELQPVQGAANPTGNLVWSSSVNSGGYSSLMTLTSGGNVGIGTTSPTYDLSFGGNAAREIWMERSTSGAGNNLTISAGGALAGTTDTAGGNLAFYAGTPTGTGKSQINFYMPPYGSSGTSDNTVNQNLMQLDWSGIQIGISNGGDIVDFGTGVFQTAYTDAAGTSLVLNNANGGDYKGRYGNSNTTNLNDVLGTLVFAGADAGYNNFSGASISSVATNVSNGTGAANLTFSTMTAGTLSPRMTILPAGNVGIGTTNPSTALQVTGTLTAAALTASSTVTFSGLSASAASSAVVCIKTNVLSTSSGGTACSNTSDIRLKRDVVTLPDDAGLGSVLKLRPVRFHWKDVQDDKEMGEQFGLIAQEVEAIFPAHGITFTGGDSTLDLGNGKKETVKAVHGVNYDRLTIPLIKAVQELKALFDDLSNKVTAVTARVNSHDAEIAALKADNDNLRTELKAANDNHAADAKAIESLQREMEKLKMAR